MSDLACDAGTVGTRAVAAVSVRGHKHRLAGEPNQDAFAIRWVATDAGPLLVAVVCDGMSSARHSAYGARRVANLVAGELASGLGERLLVDERADGDVTPALARVIATASSWSATDLGAPADCPDEVTAADLETTLTFAVVECGDGAAVRRRLDRRQPGLRAPRRSVEATRTPARRRRGPRDLRDPGPVLLASIRRSGAARIDAGAALLLCTDGIGNFLDDGDHALALGERLADAWRTPVDILTFANQASFDLPTADDDRTAVMIWPAAGLG